jgi:HSP20 family protein
MANEQVKTDNKQNRQPEGQQEARSSQQGTRSSQQGARGSQQQGALARSRSFPVGVITPIDFLRMNPFSLMRRMTEEMDRVFGDGGITRERSAEALWTPAIEVSEANGNYVVRAELPGLKPEDVKLEIEDDALVLQGERKEEREEDEGGVHRTEIRYGRFYRSIPLPDGANAEQARAKFENGVLEVTIPVPEQRAQRKEIQIQGSSAASANAA